MTGPGRTPAAATEHVPAPVTEPAAGTTGPAAPGALPPAPTPPALTRVRPVPLSRGYRFEAVKLIARWRIRLLLAACWLAPGLFVAAAARQSTLPTDTLFGRWMHATGWAGPLVVLGFAGTWALPLLTSVVAGDVFACEDRLGTWRHLLVAVRSPRRIFAAKALAGLSVIAAMVAGLALSAVAGGLLAVGDEPLVALDGRSLPPAHAAAGVALAWACVLAPTLALAAIGLLGSVALGRSPTGLLLPALVALAMRLAEMLPLPLAVRVALPGYGFTAWQGLFTAPRQMRPLVIGVVVALVWAVVVTALAYLLFVRRDFTNPTHDVPGRRALAAALLTPVALLVATAALAGAAIPAAGAGITSAKVQASLAGAFAQLYRTQTDELHRPAVTPEQVAASAVCAKGGVQDDARGPGNDWRCVVSWRLPGVRLTGTAVYQLDVAADGRFVADGDGPKDVNGYYLVRTPRGDAPNPLWQVDGIVDLLSTTPKG